MYFFLGEFLQHGAITQVELPLGASGGEYPLYDPGMQPESQVKVHDNNKTTKDNASPQAGTTFKPEEKFAALELKETVESRGDQTDQAEAVPQQPLVNGGSCKKELKEEKDQGTNLNLTVQSIFPVTALPWSLPCSFLPLFIIPFNLIVGHNFPYNSVLLNSCQTQFFPCFF